MGGHSWIVQFIQHMTRDTSSTPWGALASLALFKLFTDWQASGYPIPVDMCPNKVTTWPVINKCYTSISVEHGNEGSWRTNGSHDFCPWRRPLDDGWSYGYWRSWGGSGGGGRPGLQWGSKWLCRWCRCQYSLLVSCVLSKVLMAHTLQGPSRALGWWTPEVAGEGDQWEVWIELVGQCPIQWNHSKNLDHSHRLNHVGTFLVPLSNSQIVYFFLLFSRKGRHDDGTERPRVPSLWPTQGCYEGAEGRFHVLPRFNSCKILVLTHVSFLYYTHI